MGKCNNNLCFDAYKYFMIASLASLGIARITTMASTAQPLLTTQTTAHLQRQLLQELCSHTQTDITRKKTLDALFFIFQRILNSFYLSFFINSLPNNATHPMHRL